MDKIELETTKREVVGKKVRFLRRQGIIPAHLFGHGIKSMALQCDAAKLQRVLVKAGETKVISLKLDNEKRPRSVLAREVQVDSLKGGLLHVDFYQVKKAEEVKVEVPITLVGEAPALESRANMLMQELDTLTVECLPAKIPASVELDISSLTEAEQMVRVKSIELAKGVTILNDPELVVVKISSRPVKVVAEQEVTGEAGEASEAAPPPEEKTPKEE